MPETYRKTNFELCPFLIVLISDGANNLKGGGPTRPSSFVILRTIRNECLQLIVNSFVESADNYK